MPAVSIIIPTFNKIELTQGCLRTLYAQTPAPRHEVIVVDNGSTDGTPEFLRAEETAGRLRTILNAENAGFARACNQGAKAARGQYVVFLNNDTEVQSNWLGALYALGEADPAVAAVGAKLLFPDGTIQHAGVALADCWDHDPLLAFHLFAKEKSDFPLANQRRVYQALTAACLLVRKSHFDQAGGFDEHFWNGYEDVDLCLRFQERGWLTVYEPASVVVHYESQSGPARFLRAADNVALFHRKWLEKASPDVIIDRDGKSQITPTSAMRLYLPPSGKLVSIIILAHNQLRDTQQCLASLEKHTPLLHELILVDNGSTDGTGGYFRQYAAKHDHARVILNRSNLGFAAGNNQGLACARGDAVLLLNNDTVATPGWLERMLATLELYPECGLVGPVSNSVSGPQLVASPNYSSLDQLPKFAAQWSAAHAGQSTEAARLVGFCLLLRRAVVEKIGGLDPQFGSGNFEDDDLCLRAALAGFKLRIALDSYVHHTGGQTFKAARIDYRASLERNWELFKAKWNLPADATLDTGYRQPAAAPARTLPHSASARLAAKPRLHAGRPVLGGQNAACDGPKNACPQKGSHHASALRAPGPPGPGPRFTQERAMAFGLGSGRCRDCLPPLSPGGLVAAGRNRASGRRRRRGAALRTYRTRDGAGLGAAQAISQTPTARQFQAGLAETAARPGRQARHPRPAPFGLFDRQKRGALPGPMPLLRQGPGLPNRRRGHRLDRPHRRDRPRTRSRGPFFCLVR